MTKTELLNRCAQSEEERLLLARVLDKVEIARQRNIPAHTGFLSPQQRAAVEALLRYAFRDLGLACVWCSHYTDNPRSRRVIEKSGFSFRFEGRILDGPTGAEKPARFYTMTRGEWEAR